MRSEEKDSRDVRQIGGKGDALHRNEKRIIDFLDGFSLDGLPPDVINEAKRAVLDTLGCMIAGIDTPLGEKLRRLAEGYADKRGARVLGMEQPAASFMAAMCNSYMANAHDADDGHRRSRLHAGGIIIPSAMAAGETSECNGKAFLEAVILGFELGHRAGMATTAMETYYGSAMGSTFGAAATAGRLMGLTAGQILDAMGIAEMQAPNCMLMGWVETRKIPMIKEGMGWSAASSLMSAAMAQAGITGTLTIFNGHEQISEIEKLGREYEILRRYYKPCPGCRWAYVPLQILKDLMAKHGIGAKDVEEITVRTMDQAVTLDNPEPTTMEDAQYSIPFMLAATLVDGAFGPDQMRAEKLSDRAILALARRVKLELEPEFDMTVPGMVKSEVEVKTRSGRVYIERNQKVKGDEDFPLSDDEIKDKFIWLSRNRLSRKQALVLIDDVWSMASLRRIGDFMSSLHAMTR